MLRVGWLHFQTRKLRLRAPQLVRGSPGKPCCADHCPACPSQAGLELPQPSLGRVSKRPLPSTTRSPLILVQGHEGVQACQVAICGGEDNRAGSHSAECPRRQGRLLRGLVFLCLAGPPSPLAPAAPFLELHWVAQPSAPDLELPWEPLLPPTPSEAVPVHTRPLCLWGWTTAVGARRLWPSLPLWG